LTQTIRPQYHERNEAVVPSRGDGCVGFSARPSGTVRHMRALVIVLVVIVLILVGRYVLSLIFAEFNATRWGIKAANAQRQQVEDELRRRQQPPEQ
jgi:hypothetical protein